MSAGLSSRSASVRPHLRPPLPGRGARAGPARTTQAAAAESEPRAPPRPRPWQTGAALRPWCWTRRTVGARRARSGTRGACGAGWGTRRGPCGGHPSASRARPGRLGPFCCLREAWLLDVRSGVCVGVACLGARGPSAGLGSPTGHAEPASPARAGRELSHWLAPPRRHRERLSQPRRGLSEGVHCPPASQPPRAFARPPFRTRLRNGSPKGMRRELAGERAIKAAWSWSLQSGTSCLRGG